MSKDRDFVAQDRREQDFLHGNLHIFSFKIMEYYNLLFIFIVGV